MKQIMKILEVYSGLAELVNKEAQSKVNYARFTADKGDQ